MSTYLGIAVEANHFRVAAWADGQLSTLALARGQTVFPCHVKWDGRAGGQVELGTRAVEAYLTQENAGYAWFLEGLATNQRYGGNITAEQLTSLIAQALADAVKLALGTQTASAEAVIALPAGWTESDPAARVLFSILAAAGIRVQALVPGAVAAAVYQAQRAQVRGPILVVNVGEARAEVRVLDLVSDKQIRQIYRGSAMAGERTADAHVAMALIAKDPGLFRSQTPSFDELLSRDTIPIRQVLAAAATLRLRLDSVTLGSQPPTSAMPAGVDDDAVRTSLQPWCAQLEALIRQAFTHAPSKDGVTLVVAGSGASMGLVRHTIAKAAGLSSLGLELDAAGHEELVEQIACGAALIGATRPRWRLQLGYNIAVEARNGEGRLQPYVVARSDDEVPFLQPIHATRDRSAPFFVIERDGPAFTRLLLLAPGDGGITVEAHDVKFDLPAGAIGRRLDFWVDARETGQVELGIELIGGGQIHRRSIFQTPLPV